jgi:hypothetical protein
VTQAYKFLAPGGVGPFTGFRWPRDAWVAAPEGAGEERWIHACQVGDLPYWLGEELWVLELDGPVRAAIHQLAAPRARLVAPVSGWDGAARRALAEACAARARELAAPHGPAPRLADYVATAEACAAAAATATAAFVSATLAAELGGPVAFDAERAWQARWIADRLGLDG